MPKTLYLIDGHALAYRAYFALLSSGSRFQSTSGEPTAATFGFINILLSILEKDRPDYLAVASTPARLSAMTATRITKPRVKRCRTSCGCRSNASASWWDAFRFPRLEVEGYEADDVLGSVARNAAEKGLGVKIITGDRDLLQLVTDRVVVNLAGGKFSDAQDFSRTMWSKRWASNPPRWWT